MDPQRTGLIAGVIGLLLCWATVSAQTVSVVNNLEFGDVFPGVPKTVTKADPGAAEFRVEGNGGDEITVELLLPSYMSTSTGHSMRLVFSSNDLSMDSSASPRQDAPLLDDLNPYIVQTYGIGTNGLAIWLGGKVVPGQVQQPGDYSADITITITYTGN
jgi:hypothetical protein